MTDLCDPLRLVLTGQARTCAAMGSPFSGAVLELLAGPLAPLTADLMAHWAKSPAEAIVADAAALRLLGALHHLVLTGAAPDLAALYPQQRAVADSEALARVLPGVVAAYRAEMDAFLQGPPQTNEVRRTLALVAGFLTVAAETGLPLRCLEIGASAGLNLSWDRFRYGFSEGAGWGDPESLVRIDGEWRGPPPPVSAPLSVVERAACDIAPVDVADPVQALRLQAYVWADQTDRLERLRAAIALAVEQRVRVERADAAAWTAAHLSPKADRTTVLYHSVMWQYMPLATQAAVRATIDRAGAAATADAPVAWLRFEPPDVLRPVMELRLTLWPGGEDRLLARAHPHGAWVEWLAPSLGAQ